jgi:hypothetical protein
MSASVAVPPPALAGDPFGDYDSIQRRLARAANNGADGFPDRFNVHSSPLVSGGSPPWRRADDDDTYGLPIS